MAEPVSQDATLQDMLRYPELIFYNSAPGNHNYFSRSNDPDTEQIIREIRNKAFEHPEKRQELTDLLRSYIQKLRELTLSNERARQLVRGPHSMADIERSHSLVAHANRRCRELEERIYIALFGEQGAENRRQEAENRWQEAENRGQEAEDRRREELIRRWAENPPLRVPMRRGTFSPHPDPHTDQHILSLPTPARLPAGPLPAQRVPALPPLPQGFKQSELPNVNIGEQCNGETDSPINLEPLESDKTVKLSDGKCYSFDDIATLYRVNHRDFKSPFSRERFTNDDINIARTLIEKGYGKIEGGRKSKKSRKTRKSKKARKSKKVRKTRKSKKSIKYSISK
jgi:hypothetical protein